MNFFALIKKTFQHWKEDEAPQMAAATAYYTVFSLAPLLIILIAISSFFFDSTAVRAQIIATIESLLGSQGAQAVTAMLDAARASGHSIIATTVGIVTLLLGATGLMAQLQSVFNEIWHVEIKKNTNSLWLLILKRLFSFGLILTIGFLLIVSLVVTAGVAMFTHFVSARFDALTVALPILNIVMSFVVLFFLFAVLFKYLPDVLLRWRDVWMGAAITALLFTVGKSALGWYLGSKDFVSAYGAAGSLIVLLLWVNYSAQILFFGAEYTKTLAQARQRQIQPKHYAQFTEPDVTHSTLLPDLGVIAGFLLIEWKTAKWYATARRFLKR